MRPERFGPLPPAKYVSGPPRGRGGPRLATVDESIHDGARTDTDGPVDAARTFACGVEPRDRAVGHDVEHLGCGIDRDAPPCNGEASGS